MASSTRATNHPLSLADRKTQTGVIMLDRFGMPGSSKPSLAVLRVPLLLILKLRLKVSNYDACCRTCKTGSNPHRWVSRQRVESNGTRMAVCTISTRGDVFIYADSINNGEQSTLHPKRQEPEVNYRLGKVKLPPLRLRTGRMRHNPNQRSNVEHYYNPYIQSNPL